MLKKTYTPPDNIAITDAYFRVDEITHSIIESTVYLTVCVYKDAAEATANNPARGYAIPSVTIAADITTYFDEIPIAPNVGKTKLEMADIYLKDKVAFLSDATIV